MKNFIIYAFTIILSLALLQACGEEEQVEQERDPQAIEDSLQQARQAEMEQMRRDSIEQARADSIAAAEEKEEQKRQIQFSEDGEFVVQVEAWRSQEKAQQQAEEWKDRGHDNAYVVMYGNPDTGDVWYRVRIGRFETREIAEMFQNRLADEYNEQSWVSRLGQPVEQEAMQGD